MSYEKDFRKKLGYTNKEKLKHYYKANDIQNINWIIVERYNERLKEVIKKLHNAINSDICLTDICELNNKIDEAYTTLKNNNLFPHLNNNGRAHEKVYYNWMRGYILCELFLPAICQIFGVSEDKITHIGKDDLSNPKTFSRSATADLQIDKEKSKIRLEVQGGFTGENDIKEHKIKEAISNFKKHKITTYIFHIDVFNGKVAIINISNPESTNLIYKYNNKMESKKTLEIKPEWFKWKLNEKPLALKKL